MKQTLTIILLLLSTILYSQTKVVITTEEGKIGKFLELNQVIYKLTCIDSSECEHTLYLIDGQYGFISKDYRRNVWFIVENNRVDILGKSEGLNFTIKQE